MLFYEANVLWRLKVQNNIALSCRFFGMNCKINLNVKTTFSF